MSEITRVPLQPVAKGSLTKIWLGVAAAVVLGSGVAYATRYQGIEIETIKAGTGASPTKSDVALINYVGRLASGKEFDRGERAVLPLETVIPGFSEGLGKMQKGGKYVLEIPAEKGYGAEEKRNPQTGEVVIPANSDLVFEVELIDYKSAAELEQQRMMMEQMQRMQGGAGGAGAGGAPSGIPMPPMPEGAPQP
ncbi:MAG: peptidylprolyl isomerase [Novosphingobium sp. 28-62-57]|uniref:FKBP-type peptidyl-prolyl cis-trans isomerase n=1 Tax=unclassified Novosphingobium TaxID=2644732 RepID=UPI000BD73520|nr:MULTISPECIES: FKBP-type peptidyl-prolyl cis-trans isomerase [unclassified Novosphingobium]OYW48269.1 MAG: peptidylprolyl isomerase [Novosphingobium sp. 12-62-10]OYZ10245.1 MAG: peptidylprolyl isomerase [Novosphingobium sp. 28-62-57]OZA38038.1 MAG: peptidylprolyl isomerase [Novosphingobium sp. 17-62-9]